MPTAIPNRYAGPCVKCGQYVPSEGDAQGVAVKEVSGWRRYCRGCSPVKPSQPAPVITERKLTVDGRVIMPFDRDALPLLRSLPGAFFDGNASPKCWRVSLAPADRHRLLEVADILKLEVPAELRNLPMSEQSQNAQRAGLFGFQVFGVDWLSKGDKRLLADDMGLGKTVQTLVAVPEGMGILAVVPSGVKYNWMDEARKWRPDLTVTVIEGRGNFRLPAKGELVIINFDILPDYLEPVKRTPDSKAWEVEVRWPTAAMTDHAKTCLLVVDEAQRVKNIDTGRHKRVKGLAMSFGKVWFLTGTPLENRPEDLYGVLEAGQMALQVFGGWRRYVERMGGVAKTIMKYNPKTKRKEAKFVGYEWGTPAPEVPELLRRVMLRRTRAEAMPDLPQKVYTTVKCDVPEHLRHQMDNLWEQWGDLMVDLPMNERELPPFEEFSRLRAELAESRIPALLELVEEHEDNNVPLVVFSSHLKPLHALGARNGWAVIDGSTPAAARQGVVRDFQAGLLKGVAVSTRAGGVGLTLTRAWKAIFVDLDWVPGQNQQAEDRICRIGQTAQKCEIVRLVSDHVLDIHVVELIAWKVSLIEAAVEKATKELPQATDAADGINISEAYEERLMAAAAAVDGVGVPVGSWLPIVDIPDVPF